MKYNTQTGNMEGTPEEMLQIIRALKQNGTKKEEETPIQEKQKTQQEPVEKPSAKNELYHKGYGWTQAQDAYLLTAIRSGNMPTYAQIKRELGKNKGSYVKRARVLAAQNGLPTPTIQKKKTRTTNPQVMRRAGSKQWSPQEDTILKAEYSKPLEAPIDFTLLEMRLPGRTKKQIISRASYLEISSAGRVKSFRQAKPKKTNKYSEFLSMRIKALMKQGILYMDANRQAINEWNARKGKQKVVVQQETRPEMPSVRTPETFPKFNTLGSGFEYILQGIVQNVIKNQGKLSLPSDGYSLGVNDGMQWREFIGEFLGKTPAISAFFGVPNKFKHIRVENRYDEIHYR